MGPEDAVLSPYRLNNAAFRADASSVSVPPREPVEKPLCAVDFTTVVAVVDVLRGKH